MYLLNIVYSLFNETHISPHVRGERRRHTRWWYISHEAISSHHTLEGDLKENMVLIDIITIFINHIFMYITTAICLLVFSSCSSHSFSHVLIMQLHDVILLWGLYFRYSNSWCHPVITTSERRRLPAVSILLLQFCYI